jgi:hypothetical protein
MTSLFFCKINQAAIFLRNNSGNAISPRHKDAALVSKNLKRISFENKQKLLRLVLDKAVINEWRVDVYYNIPLPRNPTFAPLCVACQRHAF